MPAKAGIEPLQIKQYVYNKTEFFNIFRTFQKEPESLTPNTTDRVIRITREKEKSNEVEWCNKRIF